jgi:hypothetical protein
MELWLGTGAVQKRCIELYRMFRHELVSRLRASALGLVVSQTLLQVEAVEGFDARRHGSRLIVLSQLLLVLIRGSICLT